MFVVVWLTSVCRDGVAIYSGCLGGWLDIGLTSIDLGKRSRFNTNRSFWTVGIVVKITWTSATPTLLPVT